MLIKPDAVARGLIGEVLARVERKGLEILALQRLVPHVDIAREHYAEHAERPFFDSLVEFITSGPLVAAVIEGEGAIAAMRQIIGGTDPVKSAVPGTIRGDFGLTVQSNLVHGSDSPESALREIALWFPEFGLSHHR